MTTKIATKVGQSVLASQAKRYEPQDPRYETFTDEHGRERQRERPMPVGLTKEEEKILRKIRRRARRLDKGMSLCGFRVGYTFFISLIPVVGDLADFALSYALIIKPAKKCDIPAILQSQMVSTAGIGMIPILGDIIAYGLIKPNSRNAVAFEHFLIERAQSSGRVNANEQAAETTVAKSKGWSWSQKTSMAKTQPAGASVQPNSSSAAASATPAATVGAVPVADGGLLKNEAGGQVRCQICNKLFQDREFGQNHLSTKHPDASLAV